MHSICRYITILALALFPALATAEAVPIEQMKASTVRVICTRGGELVAVGSGFVVGKGNYVVTNNHVASCDGSGADLIVILGSKNKPDARIVWSSEEKDLAVLEINATGTPVLGFALSSVVNDAQTVYAMGFPGASDAVSDKEGLYEVKISKGIISARPTLKNGLKVYQTDTAINPGNSGGPLFDEAGRVVGVNVAQNRAAKEGINYSIQADVLIPELDRLGIPNKKDGISSKPDSSTPANQPDLTPDKPPTDSSKPGTSPWLYLAVGIAITLGGVSLFLVATQKGRDIYSKGKDSLSRRNDYGAAIPAVPAAGTRPVLIGVSGAFAGNEIRLGAETISIGRDPQQCQLVFPKETEGVGRLHCAIRFDAVRKVFFLTDRNSTNGTFLGNGEKMPSGTSSQIAHGGRFYLASQQNMFEVRLV